MIGFIAAVLFAVLLCLGFKATRLTGVALAAGLLLLLFHLSPMKFTALVVLGGVTLCCIYYFTQRRTSHAIPELSDRRG